MNKKTIENIDVSSKRVLVRVDFNVPLDENRNITDDRRIAAALPTINYLIGKRAKTILVSHLGRPKEGFEPKYSMQPVAKRLSELLGKQVKLANDVIGESAKSLADNMQNGDVILLENVRFHKEEEKNDSAFARELAGLAQVYVNDAFGTAHRAHASTAGVADYLPAVAGFLIKKEIEVMGKALENPRKPFIAMLGGAKISDKIGVIENLIDKVDTLIIGGGMAYTFLKAKGYNIGKSILDEGGIQLSASLIEKASQKGVKLMLPSDNVISTEFSNDSEYKTVYSNMIPDGWMGMDIGPATINDFSQEIKNAGTILWNGPMGVFEFSNFAKGTAAIAQAVAESGAISIIGGGDSAAAIEQTGFAGRITHISTGGGASLEFLEGKVLPGIDCLLNQSGRNKIVAGNWKMNKTVSETVEFINKLKDTVSTADAEVVLCVPSIAITEAVKAAGGSNIKIGAQNMHWEDEGAFTGEISPVMLKEAGVEYVIIGHSERRQYFAETDETVNKKLISALKHSLIPIVCVGESLEQREAGITAEHVRNQVIKALQGVTTEQAEGIVIAYEPIWAIGTGRTATPYQANEVNAIIRNAVKDLYGSEVSEKVVIQYGGSVKSQNAHELFGMSDIDGGLIGGASLKPDEFEKIVKS